MKVSKGIGIHLGTTNSSVAVMDLTDSDIVMYEDKLGVSTTPSCVWYDPKKNKIVVGKKAFRRRGGHPEPVVSIKRWMGTAQKVKLGDREMSPEQISAEILKELRRQIEETMRNEMSTPELEFIVDRTIITIPAYFQLPQIEATRKAGELAGLEIIELLHEPTAAAVHYSWKHNITDDCTFLVFDPGGSTFDVSVVRQTAGELEILGISGDAFLGGDDFDRRLAELIRHRLVEDDYELDLDVEHDPEDALRFTGLVLLAEGVKKRLTDRGEELLRDGNTLTDKNDQRVIIDMMITREEFEDEIRDLVNKMVPKCWEALAKAHKKAGITLKDIDYVLLVGGTSYVPLVQETARINFCDCTDPRGLSPADVDDILEQVVKEHRETVRHLIGLGERAKCREPIFEDPDTCNARGAAIRAALAGLAVYNDEGTVRMIFRGQGATTNTRATISGRVEIADDSASTDGHRAWKPLDRGRVVLELAETDFQDEEFLDSKGSFRFRKVSLQSGSVNQFNVQVYDGSGQLLATLGGPIAQSEDTVDIGTGVLTTAVLPAPIRIEGLVGGRIGKIDLIPETTSLPAEGHFTFPLQENPGYVVIPIYQGNRLIKEIRADIDPNLPPGTPIDFHITVDEQAFIVCKGKIGDHEFAAAVEPPKMEVPSQEEVDQQLAEFEEALAYRSRGDQMVLKAKVKRLQRDIDEAREGGDEPKVIERFEQLCALVDEAKNVRAELEPPKEQFDELVQVCLQLINQLVRARPEVNVEDIEKDIRTQQRDGDRAAQDMDQQAYSEAYQMLVQYARGLQAELRADSGAREEPPADPTARATGAVEYFRGACAQLRPFATGRADDLEQKAQEIQARDPKGADDLRRQARTASEMEKRLTDIDRDLAGLQSQAQTDPDGVMRKCQVIQSDLQRTYDVLQRLGGQTGTPPSEVATVIALVAVETGHPADMLAGCALLLNLLRRQQDQEVRDSVLLDNLTEALWRTAETVTSTEDRLALLKLTHDMEESFPEQGQVARQIADATAMGTVIELARTGENLDQALEKVDAIIATTPNALLPYLARMVILIRKGEMTTEEAVSWLDKENRHSIAQTLEECVHLAVDSGSVPIQSPGLTAFLTDNKVSLSRFASTLQILSEEARRSGDEVFLLEMARCTAVAGMHDDAIDLFFRTYATGHSQSVANEFSNYLGYVATQLAAIDTADTSADSEKVQRLLSLACAYCVMGGLDDC